MIECGKLARLQTYRPCEVVHGGDRGNLSSVYFVLSGDCAIFQRLQVSRGIKVIFLLLLVCNMIILSLNLE